MLHRMSLPFRETILHRAFEVGLLLKAIFAVLETLGGVVAFFISQRFLLGAIIRLTQQGRILDPDNAVAQYLLQAAQGFSMSTRHFVGLYLASHGGVKLLVLAALWREKLWAYPLAIFVFAAFIAYQLYRFTFTHSPWLMLLTLADLAVIWLTWREYSLQRHRRSQHRARIAAPASFLDHQG